MPKLIVKEMIESPYEVDGDAVTKNIPIIAERLSARLMIARALGSRDGYIYKQVSVKICTE